VLNIFFVSQLHITHQLHIHYISVTTCIRKYKHISFAMLIF